MSLGTIVYRGHMIGPSDEKHPETGKPLFSISELKPATTPPLLTTQLECKQYIKQVEPFNTKNRIDPYGYRVGDYHMINHSRKDKRVERTQAYFRNKFGSCET